MSRDARQEPGNRDDTSHDVQVVLALGREGIGQQVGQARRYIGFRSAKMHPINPFPPSPPMSKTGAVLDV